MPIRFKPELSEAEDSARVTLTKYARKERLIDAMIKAEKEAKNAGYSISWTHTLASEAHGIARRKR